ncbi:hypothetical protein, partial [Hyphomicrobium sp.]|uniref:hypothetical protein n=1 Tax=Hyphomicrobium sp. TaxID=82 RepID=UPI0025C5B964
MQVVLQDQGPAPRNFQAVQAETVSPAPAKVVVVAVVVQQGLTALVKLEAMVPPAPMVERVVAGQLTAALMALRPLARLAARAVMADQ